MPEIHRRWAADHEAFASEANSHVRRRAALAASFIRPGTRVLDLGCGAMILRDRLPEGCAYTPSDVWKRHPEIVVANLNERVFPEGEWDIVAMLGVIEYLEDPSWVLRTARARARNLLITCPLWPIVNAYNIRHPEARAQVNYFRRADFISLLKRAGWRVTQNRRVRGRRSWFVDERLFVCA